MVAMHSVRRNAGCAFDHRLRVLAEQVAALTAIAAGVVAGDESKTHHPARRGPSR
jgi:hypothetical protein